MCHPLQANGYPKREAHRLLNRRRQTKGSEDECKNKLFIPYIKGLREMIDKSCRKMGIQTIFSKQRSLRTVLSNPKQPQPPMDIKGVVYLIPCSECSAVYIGETGRTLKVRLAEHKRAVRMGDVNNGIAVHSLMQDWPLNCLGQGQDYRQGNPLAKEKGQRSHQDPEENEFRSRHCVTSSLETI